MMTTSNSDPWQHVSCPVCKADQPVFVTNDWQIINGKQYTFDRVRCKKCETVYVNPRLDREKVLGTPGGGAWHAAAQVNRAIYRSGLQRLHQHLPKSRRTPSHRPKLLDIGCGFGAFMDAAQKSGFEVEGVEIDQDIAQAASQHIRCDYPLGCNRTCARSRLASD